MTMTPDPEASLMRAVRVALDLHRSTLGSKLLDRVDRWDIFATRLQSAAESSDTLAQFCEAFARKLDVGSLHGDMLAAALRAQDAGVLRCFRDESVAVVALTRVALQEARAERSAQEQMFPDTEVSR